MAGKLSQETSASSDIVQTIRAQKQHEAKPLDFSSENVVIFYT